VFIFIKAKISNNDNEIPIFPIPTQVKFQKPLALNFLLTLKNILLY